MPTVFRNLSVLVWWIAIIAVLLFAPWLVFVGVAILICSAPFTRLILDDSDVRPLPLCAASKFSELGNMTALSAVKSMIYSGKLPGPSKYKMTDRTKEAVK